MRLSPEAIETIRATVARLAGPDAGVALFGSRLDDDARGGDVDLLIETDDGLGLLDRARIKLALEEDLGLPVDIVAIARQRNLTPFERLVRKKARRLS